MKQTASAIWSGDLKHGSGALSTHSGALKETPYSFATRFESAKGTNPEELIAAAHAGCFTMALSASLASAGFTAKRLATSATVTLEQVSGNWTITTSHLEHEAWIPGITPEKFDQIAADAKANCPVSRLLRAEVSLHAKLMGGDAH
jgi:osmotically inducible protein OsmC